MQDTYTNDHVTHAIIGGGQAIEYGISSSAEFFHILSSTLYSNQKLAVVREVLCNAWDAHIDAGIISPVIVTIVNNVMTVRDFGKGIASKDIGAIYGTYGSSTKKNDGRQTGHFGLGCKAPFAYTDHFEVTSHHAGVKTIYSMSKSSAEINGKPSIITIAALPTQETGLQVSINIEDNIDSSAFKALIKEIAYYGDIPVILNGDFLPVLGFTREYPYIIEVCSELESTVNVRYGNVVYPVETCEQILHNYTHIIEIMTKNTRPRSSTVIIFQAPPNSIAETPSRETLSMQELTCNTLNKLMAEFILEFNKEYNKACFTNDKKNFKNLSPNTDLSAVCSRRLPALFDKSFYPKRSVITNIPSLAEHHNRLAFDNVWSFRREELKNRVEFMINHKKLDRGFGMSYLKALGKGTTDDFDLKNDSGKKWFTTRVVKPLVKAFLGTDVVNLKNLYVSDSHAYYAGTKNHFIHNQRKIDKIIPFTKAIMGDILSVFPYLRNTVVISHSKTRLVDSNFVTTDIKNYSLKINSGFLLYIVGRKKESIEGAVNFFKSRGMLVIDNTIYEQTVKKTGNKGASSTPRKKGHPALSSVWDGVRINTLTAKSGEYLTEPEFYVQGSLLKYKTKYLNGFDKDNSELIFNKYGNKGVILFTRPNIERFRDKGIPQLFAKMAIDVFTYVATNKRIHQYWENHPRRIKHEIASRYQTDAAISFICDDLFLAKELGLTNSLTDEDKEYITLFQSLLDSGSGGIYAENLIMLNKHLCMLPLSKAANDLLSKIRSNELLLMINFHHLATVVQKESDPVKKQKIYDVFLSIINI